MRLGWFGVVYGCLGFRVFAVRVLLRVSYDCIGFRFFVGFRVVSRLGLFWVVYGLVGYRDFQGLEVFCG